MSNFRYTVSQKDNKGLTEIFLQKAKAEGFKEKDIDWNAVMSVFDKIQTEEKAQGQSLFSGGTNKTSAGWHNSYVIKKGDEIELDENQMTEIYKAMGFTNHPTASVTTEPAATTPMVSKPVEAPADSVKTQAEDFALPSGIADTTKVPTTPAVADTTKTQPAAEVKTAPAPVVKDTTPAPAVVVTPKTVKAPEIVPAAKPETIPAPTATKDKTNAQPAAEVKDVKKAEAPKDSSKTVTEETPDAKKYNTIDMENIKGDYKISAGQDGKRFTLLSDVSVQGTPNEEQKFFRPITYNEEKKQYSVRNLKSTDEQVLMDMAHSEAKELATNQAIYTDLNTKASSGTTLSEPEKAFMTSHKESLKTMGLQLNDKNEIAEIPKPIPLKQPKIEQKAAEPDTSLWEKITNW